MQHPQDKMLRHLIDNCLCENLELSAGQVTTLLALLEVPVMDYHIVEILQLYPRSKMRKNVLDPLRTSGWIIFHSLPPTDSDVGAPRIAWSLRSERSAELQEIVSQAEEWSATQLRKGRAAGVRLASDLFLDT